MNRAKWGSRARRAATRTKQTARDVANLHPLEPEGLQNAVPDPEAILLDGANKEQEK